MKFRVLSKFLATTALACAALAGAGVLPAAAATGASAPSAVSATSAAWATSTSQEPSAGELPQVDRTCPIVSNRFAIYTANCAVRGTHSCSSFGALPFVPSYASNGCRVRVLLFTRAHGQGHSLCISPHSATRHLSRNYVWFRVTSNRHAC